MSLISPLATKSVPAASPASVSSALATPASSAAGGFARLLGKEQAQLFSASEPARPATAEPAREPSRETTAQPSARGEQAAAERRIQSRLQERAKEAQSADGGAPTSSGANETSGASKSARLPNAPQSASARQGAANRAAKSDKVPEARGAGRPQEASTEMTEGEPTDARHARAARRPGADVPEAGSDPVAALSRLDVTAQPSAMQAGGGLKQAGGAPVGDDIEARQDVLMDASDVRGPGGRRTGGAVGGARELESPSAALTKDDAAPLRRDPGQAGDGAPGAWAAQLATEMNSLPAAREMTGRSTGAAPLDGLAAVSAAGSVAGAPLGELAGAPHGEAPAAASTYLATPVDAPEFPKALGTQISVLVREGLQQAELHLNPAEMGPISIQIALEGTQAQVDFGADSAHTRQVIENGLPELASALRDAGFTLSGGGVHQQSAQQRDGRGAGQGGGTRTQEAAAGADSPRVEGPGVARSARISDNGVDVYA